MKFRLIASAVFLLTLLVGVVLHLPALWADRALAAASSGVLRLASPVGSLWAGQAQLQIAADRILATPDPEAEARDSREARSASFPSASPSTPLQAIPGLLRWRLSPTLWGDASRGIPALSLVVRLEHPALQGAMATQPLVLGLGRALLPPGELRLPELDLQSAGGPLALIKPRLTPLLRWDRLSVSGGPSLAEPAVVVLELDGVSSRLSPVRPLGSYRLSLSAPAGPAQRLGWRLQSSESSVLDLTGSGQFDQRLSGSLEMRCRRNCEFVEGLMAAVGQKNGDRYVANLGL